MSMIDFPKIDSQGFFHDWNGFAMDRFNDPHLPSAGFTRRGVTPIPPVACLLDADPLDSLSQIIARTHLGVQRHIAYRRGQRETRVCSVPGSGARA